VRKDVSLELAQCVEARFERGWVGVGLVVLVVVNPRAGCM
jgi:hypothetical protein